MKNWGLSKKIWSVVGILAFSFIGSIYMSVTQLQKLDGYLKDITRLDVKRDQLTSQIQFGLGEISTATLAISLEPDKAKLDAYQKDFERAKDAVEESYKAYYLIASIDGKQLIEKSEEAYHLWLSEMVKSTEFGHALKNSEAFHAFANAEAIRENLRTHILAAKKLTAASLAEKSIQADEAADQAILTSIILAGASILLSLVIAFLVLRATTGTINSIVKNLFDSSAQVSSAAAQISSSSEELSQATTEQAASLEETAASIEEMNSMVNKNSENATSTASTSGKSQEKATQGKQVVEKMIQSMAEISESNNTIMKQIDHSNAQFSEIVKVIEEIGNKTKVINDIVFQTKLLSFNASVEAARAGEHGKGFAVVAEEVGNLAQMSGNAATEISSMLEGSIQKVNAIVNETKASVTKLISEGKDTVEAGTVVARQCGEVLDEIVVNVDSVTHMAHEIAQASQEQARGVSEITNAMTQLDTVTQQNSATSEETASAAEELAAQSETMKNAVSLLLATIQGKNGTAPNSKDFTPKTSSVEKRTIKTEDKNKILHLSKVSSDGAPSKEIPRRASGDPTPTYDDKRFKDV